MTRKRRYPNVTSFVDRHGKRRWRWRKAGHESYYFRNPPDTPGFAEELAAVQSETRINPGLAHTIPKSVGDLVARYYGSTNFNRGGAADQRRRRLLIESFRAEFADDLITHFTWQHIEAILRRRADKRTDPGGRQTGGPFAAQSLRKQLRRLFAFAVRLEWITHNPVDQAERTHPPRTAGYHSWTEAEIEAYQAAHPLGSQARTALEIMLWTGQRRGDARLFGPEHVVNGEIRYQQGKTGTVLSLPLAEPLRAALDAAPRPKGATYLETARGQPYTKAGIGNQMRAWCDAAGLSHCTAHGLRKAMARRLAENNATQAAIKAVGGWRSDQDVATYTAAASQRNLAATAISRMERNMANPGQRVANEGGQAHE